MSESTNSGSGRKTLVEEGTHFKGSLSSNCPIEVKGRVEGDLTAPALAISASGAVHGKVKVGEMRSQGELAGEFDADVVQLSGTVKDNTIIRAKSLEVRLSSADSKMQVVFGECSLEVGGEAATTSVASQAEAATRAPEPPKVVAPSVHPPADANGA